MTTKARELFETLAPEYDRKAFGSTGLAYVSQIEAEFVQRTLDVGPGTRLIEVGVGTGRNMKLLDPRSDVVVGVDISPGMMGQVLSDPAGRRAHLMLSDIGKGLPFRDAEFDRVLCLRVLKYVPNWQFGLAELARVLKPGGTMVFDIANRRSISRISTERKHVHLISVGELERAARDAGIGITDRCALVRAPHAVYARVQSQRALSLMRRFERAADALLPGTLLSRWILFSATKPAGASV